MALKFKRDSGTLYCYLNNICVGQATLCYPDRTNPMLIEIESLTIDIEQWGKGFGWALLQETLAWCREEGCTCVQLFVFPENHRAIELYERAGFRVREAYYDVGLVDMEMRL